MLRFGTGESNNTLYTLHFSASVFEPRATLTVLISRHSYCESYRHSSTTAFGGRYVSSDTIASRSVNSNFRRNFPPRVDTSLVSSELPPYLARSVISRLNPAIPFARYDYWFKSKFSIGVKTDSPAIRRYIRGKRYTLVRSRDRVHASIARSMHRTQCACNRGQTRNRRAGCAGSNDERASSKNLRPEIFVILKWNCPHARMPWHGSLLPFEIVRRIGVSKQEQRLRFAR